MQRVLMWCGISTLVVLTVLFGYGFQARAQATGTIKGKVTGDGNVALANVPVKAYYKEEFMGIIQWGMVGQTTTDNTGAYTISNLNAGTYHVSFNEYPPVAGYFMEFYNNAGTQESATDITLAEGATVNNINAQLSSGAHIQGQVTDLQGKPLASIRVLAFDSNNTAPADQFADTGADGRYDIGHMVAGSYRLVFEDQRQPPIYHTEYYNNQQAVENSTFVTLATDQILNNVNAQLDRLGFITGKVTNAQNSPLQNIQLVAEQFDGSLWYEKQYAVTNATGNYTLGGLAAGRYRVRFRDVNNLKYSAEYYDNVTDPTVATPLTITLNTTATNINAQLALRGGITGKITNLQGEPIQGVEVKAETYVTTVPGWYWENVRTTYSNATGDYALCCLDGGNYRLRFTDTLNRYVSEYYQDVYYDYNSPLDNVTMVQVTATMTTTAINTQLSRFSNIVSHVLDQRGQPITDLTLALYRYNPAGSGQWYNLYTNIEKINDTYQMTVAPGRYRLAITDGRSPARYVSEFYDNAVDVTTATDITVTEETTVTLEATLADKTRITGKVTDPNGNPAPNVAVAAYVHSDFPGMAWGQVANTFTTAAGEYSLDGLNPGTYRVGFHPSFQFTKEYYNDAATIETATDIVVPPDTVIANINAQLGRLSLVKGQVTNSAGQPLTNIQVAFYYYGNTVEDPSRWQYTKTAYTDDNGIYTSEGLDRGVYRIGFQDFNHTYHPAFYNNAGYLENATTITITTDMTITGINAQLPANPFTWPPFAQDDQLVVAEGGTISSLSNGMSTVLANDRAESGGLLQAHLMELPTHGTLSFNPDGTFTYTHNGDEATSDAFGYMMNDGVQSSEMAMVAITIQPINDLPTVRNDSLTVARGQGSATLDTGAQSLLANDSDPDSPVLTATLKSGPAHGAVTINANGTFTYTHDGSSGDSDSFTYQAKDALGASAVATVTVAVNPFTFSKTVSIAGIKPLCTPVDEIRAPVGTTIVYCYTIRNIGNAPLTTHTLVDSHLGTLLTNHNHAVAAGAAFSVTFTQTLTISTTNIATWTATSGTAQALTTAAPSATAKKAATVIIASAADDSDGDSIPDNLEKAGDIDGDNLPNFLDTDADGDGKVDKEEAGSNPAQPLDSNQNGVPDYLESQSGTGAKTNLFLPLIKR